MVYETKFMSNYKPPYQITDVMIDLLSQISELVGKWSMTTQGELSPELRKKNRIKTIQASLAIENNTLTVAQVAAIMNGERVLGLPHEILEVKNAIEAYANLIHWKSTAVSHLLAAHQLLMQGLKKDAGKLRNSDVGIYKDIKLMHMAPPVKQIPVLLDDLVDWCKNTKAHPLIKSCIFHYEFEFIHPFSDGNGRMGRMWQTLMLSEWNPLLAYLPIETLIKKRQKEYYEVLGKADSNADSTVFIEFMLHAIKEELSDGINDGINDGIKLSDTDKIILKNIKSNPRITAQELKEKIHKSLRTIERSLKKLKTQKYINRIGSNKTGYWKVMTVGKS